MTVTYAKEIQRNGERHVYCECYSDTVPSPLPTVADIPGYADYDQIAVGSYLVVVGNGAIYLANEQGTFVEQ